MVPKIWRPYHNCTVIEINSRRFYFSYETVIAYENISTNFMIRTKDFISRTTSKHFSKMNISNFEKIQNDLFYQLVNKDSI